MPQLLYPWEGPWKGKRVSLDNLKKKKSLAPPGLDILKKKKSLAPPGLDILKNKKSLAPPGLDILKKKISLAPPGLDILKKKKISCPIRSGHSEEEKNLLTLPRFDSQTICPIA